MRLPFGQHPGHDNENGLTRDTCLVLQLKELSAGRIRRIREDCAEFRGVIVVLVTQTSECLGAVRDLFVRLQK